MFAYIQFPIHQHSELKYKNMTKEVILSVISGFNVLEDVVADVVLSYVTFLMNFKTYII